MIGCYKKCVEIKNTWSFPTSQRALRKWLEYLLRMSYLNLGLDFHSIEIFGEIVQRGGFMLSSHVIPSQLNWKSKKRTTTQGSCQTLKEL